MGEVTPLEARQRPRHAARQLCQVVITHVQAHDGRQVGGQPQRGERVQRLVTPLGEQLVNVERDINCWGLYEET